MKNIIYKETLISYLLTISLVLILLGRAWQHLFWDAPYRSFFWNESILKPIIESFTTLNWTDYITSKRTDFYIQLLIQSNGILYIFAIIAIYLFNYLRKISTNILLVTGGSLLLLALLLTKEKFYHTAQFFEHSIQFGAPFLFIYYKSNYFNFRHFIYILKILVALTFFSHGLYAFGFYPLPGKFVDMTIQIIKCNEEQAIFLLYIAGILDFLVAILIFIPFTAKPVLLYAAIWGIITAFARVFANFNVEFIFSSLHQFGYQTIYRLPHGIFPLLLYFIIQRNYNLIPKKVFFKTSLS